MGAQSSKQGSKPELPARTPELSARTPDLVFDPQQKEKMDLLQRQIVDGLRNFHRSCESQKLWNNIKPSLKELLISSKLPPVPHSAFNNPHDVDHLMQHINEIERLLFVEVDYDKALATAVAMRSLFKKSKLPGINRLLSGGALSLLQKVYARGHMSSISYTYERHYKEYDDDDDGDDVSVNYFIQSGFYEDDILE